MRRHRSAQEAAKDQSCSRVVCTPEREAENVEVLASVAERGEHVHEHLAVLHVLRVHQHDAICTGHLYNVRLQLRVFCKYKQDFLSARLH